MGAWWDAEGKIFLWFTNFFSFEKEKITDCCGTTQIWLSLCLIAGENGTKDRSRASSASRRGTCQVPQQHEVTASSSSSLLQTTCWGNNIYLGFYVCNLSVLAEFLCCMNYVFKVWCFLVDYGDLNMRDYVRYGGNKLIKVIICYIHVRCLNLQLIKYKLGKAEHRVWCRHRKL